MMNRFDNPRYAKAITFTNGIFQLDGKASEFIVYVGATGGLVVGAPAQNPSDKLDPEINPAQGKAACALASTANVALTAEQTIDGTLTSTSRILLKDQTDPSENGIWVTAAGAWARATDADIDGEVNKGMFLFVTGGTANGGTGWVLTTGDPITVDTTDLLFKSITMIPFEGAAIGYSVGARQVFTRIYEEGTVATALIAQW